MSENTDQEERKGPSRRLMLSLEVLALMSLTLPAILDPLFGVRMSSWNYLWLRYWGAGVGGEIPRVAIVLFVIYASGDPLRRFGLRQIDWLRDLTWFFAAAAAVALLYWGYFSLFPSHWNPNPTDKPFSSLNIRTLNDAGIQLTPLWMLAIFALIVGVAEELTFRGYLIPRLEELFGSTWLAVFVQALLFGLVHTYQGFPGMIVTALFGAILGIIFVRTRTIWPLVLAHALIDFVFFYIALQKIVPASP